MQRECAELAELLEDYRRDGGVQINAKSVETWARQFRENAGEAVVQELCHIFGSSYLSKARCNDFISRMICHTKLIGREDPSTWWRNTYIFRGQSRGLSQREMLAMLDESLLRSLGPASTSGSHLSERVLYFDDGLFTGSRAKSDIRRIVASSHLDRIDLVCVFLACHTLGAYQLRNEVARISRESGKAVTISLHCWLSLENKRAQRSSSDVYWPAAAPAHDSVQEFLSRPARFPFTPRSPSPAFSSRFFSSEEARQLIESEFLVAGANLIGACANPRDFMRPLGFSDYGVGFGSLVATYRNCPNNCPLALWWGGDGQFGRNSWQPLLPRRTN